MPFFLYHSHIFIFTTLIWRSMASPNSPKQSIRTIPSRSLASFTSCVLILYISYPFTSALYPCTPPPIIQNSKENGKGGKELKISSWKLQYDPTSCIIYSFFYICTCKCSLQRVTGLVWGLWSSREFSLTQLRWSALVSMQSDNGYCTKIFLILCMSYTLWGERNSLCTSVSVLGL